MESLYAIVDEYAETHVSAPQRVVCSRLGFAAIVGVLPEEINRGHAVILEGLPVRVDESLQGIQIYAGPVTP